MAVDLLLGLQWGDEGKGKIVDVLTSKYNIIARFQGGPNAGHTLVFNGKKHVLHTIPSGIFHENTINLVGNGVVIDPVIFKKELDKLDEQGVDYMKSLLISRKAHIILPTHRLLDAASEASKGKAKIGSTLKGIGPTYMDKTGRNGIRVGDIELSDWKKRYRTLADKHEAMISFYNVDIQYDLNELELEFFEAVETLKSLKFIDSEEFIHQAQHNEESILAEGAQGSLLDIDFGTYPFVTSSNTTSGGACTGSGMPPHAIDRVVGVCKAYTTRVGSGPFPAQNDEIAEFFHSRGLEFGATTGRPRRCGWLDTVLIRYAVMVNGVTDLAVTILDGLDDRKTIKICVGYNINGEIYEFPPAERDHWNDIVPIYQEVPGWQESTTACRSYDDLPQLAKDYLARIEELTGAPVSYVGVGPDREQTIIR